VILFFNTALARNAYMNLNALSFSEPPSALTATFLTMSLRKVGRKRAKPRASPKDNRRHAPILSGYLIRNFN
jgi:hypothetical protein